MPNAKNKREKRRYKKFGWKYTVKDEKEPFKKLFVIGTDNPFAAVALVDGDEEWNAYRY